MWAQGGISFSHLSSPHSGLGGHSPCSAAVTNCNTKWTKKHGNDRRKSLMILKENFYCENLSDCK